MPARKNLNPEHISALWDKLRDVNLVADELGVTPQAVRYHLRRKAASPMESATRGVPRAGEVRRYLLTSAQDRTPVHEAAWRSLMALRDEYDAELLVAPFTYGPTKGAWWDSAVEPFLCSHRVQLAPDLLFCGEMNTLPTAENPLSGLKSYAEGSSAVFPHAKILQESIATARGLAAKMQFTTGTMTESAYQHRKTGLKAEFHHSIAAVVVEVDHAGTWWARHITFEKATGRAQDLDVVVDGDEVSYGNRVEVLTWGDFHVAQMDDELRELLVPILEDLRPRYQVVHDLLDFYARNHHDIDNPDRMHERWVQGKASVREELLGAADVLRDIERPWCHTVVVNSNHDEAMGRWTRDTRGHKDPPNRRLWHELNAAKIGALEDGVRDFHLLEWAMGAHGAPSTVQFLRPDESFVVDGIQYGMHGHDGSNGTKGSPQGFYKLGMKATTAHTHSAYRRGGLMTVGTWSSLDPHYASGPSSWSHTLAVTYPNGKRALLTLKDGRLSA